MIMDIRSSSSWQYKWKKKEERNLCILWSYFHITFLKTMGKGPVLNLTKWKENPIFGHQANTSGDMNAFYKKKSSFLGLDIYRNLDFPTETWYITASHKFPYLLISLPTRRNCHTGETSVESCSAVCVFEFSRKVTFVNKCYPLQEHWYVFHYFEANIEWIGSYIICTLHTTGQRYRCLSVKPVPSFHLVLYRLLPSKKNLHFMSPFWNLERTSMSSKWWKAFLPGKAFPGIQILVSVLRWSTCNAWQHIWFSSILEERYATCHNDSLPPIPASNVRRDSASNSERIFIHCHGKIDFIRAKDLNHLFQDVLSRDERRLLTSLLYVPKTKLSVLDCSLGKF